MRYLIVSDIHGGYNGTKLIYDLYSSGKFDLIIILGDILYHGPRNDLPADYKPKECIKLLNELKDYIVAIRGNCDAYVDEMVLDFKFNDSMDLKINGLNAHLEHGHFLDSYNGNSDIVLYGHTHILKIEKKDNKIYFNPGSITLPKNNTPKTYAIWDEHTIEIISVDGKVIERYGY